MKYTYFVSFSVDGFSMGNAEVTLKTKITTFKDLTEIANLLKEDANKKRERKIESIIITNFILLEGKNEEGILSQE